MVDESRVFVVHGRNLAARDAMFSFLRSLGLRPMEWEQAVAFTRSASPYVGEVLDHAFAEAQAIVVLFTPDDVAYIRSEYSDTDDPERHPRGQARPNVLFEAGMAIGHDAKRTVLVEMGDLRPFTDIAGRHTIRLSNDPRSRKSLAERLGNAGCAVDLSGSDWMSEGDFTAPPKPGGGGALGRRIPTNARTEPKVDGRWLNSGSSKFDAVKITNTGVVDLMNVELVVPEALAADVQLHESGPIGKLPAGKTFTARGWTTNKTMGGSQVGNTFELRLVAELEDGTPFEQDVWFDAS